MVVAAFAKGLPVAFVPKQLLVAPVRDDVVNYGGGRELTMLHTFRTQRMDAEKPCRCDRTIPPAATPPQSPPRQAAIACGLSSFPESRL